MITEGRIAVTQPGAANTGSGAPAGSTQSTPSANSPLGLVAVMFSLARAIQSAAYSRRRASPVSHPKHKEKKKP